MGTFMETEIELKFFVSSDFAPFIQKKINSYKVLQKKQRHLINIYYDTPDLSLRRHDMGFRVRQYDGVFVQTLKTAGRVVAGLHQRPEYNAELPSSSFDLSLISPDTWPADLSLKYLSEELIPLFSTNFERQQWLLSMPDGSQVELAFDLGEVASSEGANAPISEVEIELKSGQMEALFSLARELAEYGNLRLGNLSKAAKGYRLVTNFAGDEVSPLSLVPINASLSTEDAFIKALEYGLSHWHYHEQIYTERATPDALKQICQAVNLIRQTFAFYGGLIPRRASALLRQELQWLETELAWVNQAAAIEKSCEDKGYFLRKLNAQKLLCQKLQQKIDAFPNPEQILTLFHSSRYCKLLLDLNRWILTRGWQPFLDDKARDKLAANITEFAARSLNTSWDELNSAFSVKEGLDKYFYLDQKARLQRNIVAGNCVAILFDKDERAAFRLPWLDILDGIKALELLDPIRQLIVSSDADLEFKPDDKKQIEKWLARKEEALLNAMDQSRQKGLMQSPYWLKG